MPTLGRAARSTSPTPSRRLGLAAALAAGVLVAGGAAPAQAAGAQAVAPVSATVTQASQAPVAPAPKARPLVQVVGSVVPRGVHAPVLVAGAGPLVLGAVAAQAGAKAATPTATAGAAMRAQAVRAQARAARAKVTASRSSARKAASARPARAALSGSPKTIARSLVASKGWGAQQFRCLEKLWDKESDWIATADNPTSSAYGIPQALPGHKMASEGPRWRTDPATQIRWGLKYIDGRYGTPCEAWAHSRANNWY